MKPAQIETFFRLLTKDRKIPRTELEYINPYTLLVAVVLSAQATDVGVNKATEPLFPDRRHAGEDGRARRGRAERATSARSASSAPRRRTSSRCASTLIEQHGGEVPRTREALEALPGVGRKTANVVLNIAFGEPTIAVDTHIFRVGNRTGLAPGKNAARGRGRAREGRAGRIQAARASLADPARPLYLHRAQAEMSGMPGASGLRIQSEIDARRFCAWEAGKGKASRQSKTPGESRSAVARKEIEPSSPRKRGSRKPAPRMELDFRLRGNDD